MEKRILALSLSLCIILSLITVLPITASAESGICGADLTWTLDNGTLTISGTGNMYNYEHRETPWYRRCSYIESIIIENGVTGIGKEAFSDCKLIKSITIPDSVVSIGWRSFASCTSLESITIPDSVKSIDLAAFISCTSLKSVTIPDGITKIDVMTFSGCTSLESIEIPDSVTEIGGGAFDNTAYYNNQSNWENGVLYLGKNIIKADESLSGSYSIKQGTKVIGTEAFSGCSSLSSITIPDSVVTIGYGAFQGCGFESVTIPDGVEKLDYGAFIKCSNLKSITIPDSVTSIGDAAFEDCTSLTGIKIPDGVTRISSVTFFGCTSLESVTIPESVVSIGYAAFEYCSGLADIYYGGTEKSWNKVSVARCNDALTGAAIHYGNVTVNGEFVSAYYDNNLLTVNIRLKYMAADDCRVILGVYNKNGALIDLKCAAAAKTDTDVTLSCAADESYNGCHIKVFFWSVLNGIRPLGGALYNIIDG